MPVGIFSASASRASASTRLRRFVHQCLSAYPALRRRFVAWSKSMVSEKKCERWTLGTVKFFRESTVAITRL